MQQPPSNLEQTVRVTQIITGAMVVGVVTFAAIAVLVVGALKAAPWGVIVSGLGAAFAVMAFVLHLVIPAVITANTGRAIRSANAGGAASDQQLYGIYVTKTITGLALLEGAAFFNIIALIVEHNWWSLAIVGGLVFWMLAMFPTQTRVAHWVETRRMHGPGEGH
jgi:hypothetical protein